MINFVATTPRRPDGLATANDVIRQEVPASLGRVDDILVREPNRVTAVVLQSSRGIAQADRQSATSAREIRGHGLRAGNANLPDFRSPPSRIDARQLAAHGR